MYDEYELIHSADDGNGGLYTGRSGLVLQLIGWFLMAAGAALALIGLSTNDWTTQNLHPAFFWGSCLNFNLGAGLLLGISFYLHPSL